MTTGDPLSPTVLSRKAVVCVRQSTQSQFQVHLESQRRQDDLVDEARRHGFHDVEVIDDGLGRSTSGAVARPASELVARLSRRGPCRALLRRSRLARNGRDWHHLLERAASSMPALPTSMASTPRADRMIACFSE